MNYAYITKSERKAGATEAAYREALALARAQHGARHGMVEKIKYEMSAFLGSTGREVGGRRRCRLAGACAGLHRAGGAAARSRAWASAGGTCCP